MVEGKFLAALADWHPMSQFRRRVVALTVLAGSASLWACSHGGSARDGAIASGSTIDTLPPPESTLPGGVVTKAYVVERVIRAVGDGVGLVFPPEGDACLRAGLTKSLSSADVAAIGVDGPIGEQSDAVQAAIFGIFDGCFSGDDVAGIASAALINAGATDEQAGCLLAGERNRLGFAGMYRFQAGLDGEIDPEPRWAMLVQAVYDDCKVDPTQLVPITLPLPTNPANSTVAGETTTTPPTTRPGDTTTVYYVGTTSGPPITLGRPASTAPTTSAVTPTPNSPVSSATATASAST